MILRPEFRRPKVLPALEKRWAAGIRRRLARAHLADGAKNFSVVRPSSGCNIEKPTDPPGTDSNPEGVLITKKAVHWLIATLS